MKEIKITTEISIIATVSKNTIVTDIMKYNLMFGIKECIEHGMGSEFSDVNIGEVQLEEVENERK
jgi:hypothetical protein